MWSTIRYESRIRCVRHKTNLFGVRIRDHETKRIHGFAKQIHVSYTNLIRIPHPYYVLSYLFSFHQQSSTNVVLEHTRGEGVRFENFAYTNVLQYKRRGPPRFSLQPQVSFKRICSKSDPPPPPLIFNFCVSVHLCFGSWQKTFFIMVYFFCCCQNIIIISKMILTVNNFFKRIDIKKEEQNILK